MTELEASATLLRGTRPTAVNLFWAITRILNVAQKTLGDVEDLVQVIVQEAKKMADEDVAINREIGKYGSTLIADGDIILTHCNAGGLATVEYGTALGVIRAAWDQGKQIKVVATETRPLLQGARLTAYELHRDHIPVTLITDNMAGFILAKNHVNLVVVGADRILQDAVVNKIGTYSLAVLARAHGVPFYVAAPTSTMDLRHTSHETIIEERDSKEVTHFHSKRISPRGITVMNPAFDVTPMNYIRAVITENGILSPEELVILPEM
jgi:methylthioribose-1-phosphate isomerase